MKKRNLYQDTPRAIPEEIFESLLETEHFKLERILSRGHVTPPGEWYDQATHEWVILLSGAARLLFEDESALELQPGDYVYIPAHKRHRVEWTDPDRTTVWLALHYG